MYSYGDPGRADPWSREGQERYARLSRREQPQRNIHQMMSGSCENNAGPAMYNRQAYRATDQKNQGSNASKATKPVHADLQWDVGNGPQTANWVQSQQSGAAVGASGDGAGGSSGGNGNANSPASNNDINSNNWANDAAWGKPPSVRPSNSGSRKSKSNSGSNRDQTSGGDNAWPADTGGNDPWGPPAFANSPQPSGKSDMSGGSKKSTNEPVVNTNDEWGSSSNNVGISRVVSHGSAGSKNSKTSKTSNKSIKSQNGGAPADQVWDNNAGPTMPQQNNSWGSGPTEDPSQHMPGAFTEEQGGMANATFHQTGPAKDAGGVPWGDVSAAQW